MIGKILGAVVGAKVAESSGKIGSSGGAVVGLAASILVRRMSLPSLLALAAGGYAARRLSTRRNPGPHRRADDTQSQHAVPDTAIAAGPPNDLERHRREIADEERAADQRPDQQRPQENL